MATRIHVDPSWKASLEAIVEPTLDDVGQKIEDAAKRLVPVDSGKLRDSIDHKTEGFSVVVTAGDSDVDYAAAVELGTRHMPAQPFLRPAATSVGASLR